MDFGQSFQNMVDSIAETAPKILVFLLILIVGWIIAKALRKLVNMVLERLSFDRLVERGVVGDALRRSDYDASGLLAAIVYYGILLVALQMAFGVFGPNPISDLLAAVVGWLPHVFVAIVLVVVASAIAKVVRDLVATALGNVSYGQVIAEITGIFIVALGVIAALNQIGIATTVTQPVLITVLATVGAVIAIGVGGGLVRPMQARWERILNTAEQETEKARTGGYERGREDAARGGGVPAEGTSGTEHTEPR